MIKSAGPQRLLRDGYCFQESTTPSKILNMAKPEFNTEHRRDFMKTVTKQTLGLSFAGSVASQGLFGEANAAPQRGKAKHIIYLFMDGAMTHLDTFDPKVGVEEAGETKPIQTRVPGRRVWRSVSQARVFGRRDRRRSFAQHRDRRA